jgi:hypothetical protein
MAKSGTAHFATVPDESLHHLQAELARIDVLIRREVWRWQLAGQDVGEPFRGLHVSAAEAEELSWRPLGTSWGQLVDLDPEEERVFSDALAEASHQAEALVQEANRQGHVLRLRRLVATFGLDRFDIDVLLICLAPALDLRYERLYGFLQDDVTRRRPRVNLVLDLLSVPGPERLLSLSRFSDEAPLFRYHLLDRFPEPGPDRPPLLGHVLGVDESIVTWLLGHYQPHRDLGPHAVLVEPSEGGRALLLDDATQAELARVLAGGRPVCALYGLDGTGQQAAAHWLALEAGRPLLQVDLDRVIDAGLPPAQALSLALRDAQLTGAIPYLTGWDACLQEGVPPAHLLAQVCTHPDLVLIAAREAWQPQGVDRDRHFFGIEFPIPTYPQRRALWLHFLGQAAAEDRVAGGGDAVGGGFANRALNVTAVAGQFLLTAGQIRDAVASARDRAAQRGESLTGADLLAAARLHSNPRLSSLAPKIVPRYRWQDIVLPGDQLAILHEIVDTVRARPLVLDQWGVGQKLASSAGVTVLFAGPPGTGKTMAAEIIAAELGLDLYKIDLSSIVSKYIGETEKNLERIFGEAQRSNAILFFDEADAIFGKRSEVKDAHDRYANIEISYLLQRMEAYDGVTILATNLRANVDEAFTRRLQFAIDFPFPEKEDRLRIWQTLFPPDLPRDEDLDLALLARRFKLAGGNIRNIIVSAAYLAAADGGRVTMKHLLHGTRRELQKMGRLVDQSDMTMS